MSGIRRCASATARTKVSGSFIVTMAATITASGAPRETPSSSRVAGDDGWITRVRSMPL